MTKKYSEIVSIRGQRAAYNIENEKSDDWKSFIANEQFNEILRKVISSVRNNDIDMHKSFWISGTYGTGKSHAAAVIKHILCDTVENVFDYVNEEYKNAKYNVLRNEIFKLRENKRLFPVMLYGQSSIAHKEDLSLQLQTKITAALKNAGIDLSVKTDFENYIIHIKEEPKLWDDLIETNSRLKSVTPTRQKLINELQNGDLSTLDKVRSALRDKKIDIRIENAELKKWFFEVQQQLSKSTDFDGLLVIWDEFTDVMSSPIGMSLLVTLQEIDEMVMNEENNSYFLYISHPSALNSLREDEREKTKGRYHYMGYNMEPVSAFKIMSRKFKVEENNKITYFNLGDKFYRDRIDLLEIYSGNSTNPEETRSDIRNLFPLHPSTANLATYYAREAGSSSRSVFQFIGENEAIREFLDSEVHYENLDTITADYLWDYVVVEFNNNVSKFGAVTERFNSRKSQVEAKGVNYYAVFKSILLLNALNNIANNETVTPSEDNINYLFAGTKIESELPEILTYFDENGIIQRQPGGHYSIQFTALPAKEIEDIKEELIKTQYKYTSDIVNFGETARSEIERLFLKSVNRANQFLMFSIDSNEHTLLNRIDNGIKSIKSYEVYIAMMFARNSNELNLLKEIAEKASSEERFKNAAFIVFESVFGDKNFERFIEFIANATCAQKHGFADQQKTHTKCANDMIREWMNEIRRGNFKYFIRGNQDSNATIKIASTINSCISPLIFNQGAESLDLIQSNSSKTYWAKVSAKQVVDSILSYNNKADIVSKCGGVSQHVIFLLQDSVDENLDWKSDINPNHPLYLVSDFIKRKFDHTDKNSTFNIGDKLIDLTKPPFGLYQTYAGMAMVAFAMRRYIKQILDTNGKPREAQHLVDDIVDMFKAWENEKQNPKLYFRFESKETRKLCDYIIKVFKLKELKEYNDISSLTDARWAITHEFSKTKGFPLWSLKYASNSVLKINDGVKNLADNILKICTESDIRNPQLISETLSGLEDYQFELGNLLIQPNSFRRGFEAFLKTVDVVKLQDDEVDEAISYLYLHLQSEIGLWAELEVIDQLKNWRLSKVSIPEDSKTQSQNDEDSSVIEKKHEHEFSIKKKSAKEKIQMISEISHARTLLDRICDNANEEIIDIIGNYDV